MTVDSEGRDGSEIDPEQYDIGAFRQLMEDVRDAYEREMESYKDRKDQAWKTVRFNALAGTIISAALLQTDLSIPPDPLVFIFLMIGSALIVQSTWDGIKAQRTISVKVGPAEEDVDLIRTGQYSEVEYLAVYAKKYDNWRQEVKEATDIRTFEVRKAMSFSFGGIVIMLIGVVLTYAP